MNALLNVSQLSMKYGSLTAVDEASLQLMPGQFLGLIGPNGSGKSSLLKCIAGAQIATGGQVMLKGVDVTRMTPAERSILGMSLKFQVTSIFPKLSVYDNLLVAQQAGSNVIDLAFSRSARDLREHVDAALARSFLLDQADSLASDLSHGQQQWLEIAMAMCRQPSVLLLDEPTAGMSPQERRKTGEFLRQIRDKTALIIVEHDLDFVCDVCDQLAVLDQGKLIVSGETQQVREDSRVKDIYINHG